MAPEHQALPLTGNPRLPAWRGIFCLCLSPRADALPPPGRRSSSPGAEVPPPKRSPSLSSPQSPPCCGRRVKPSSRRRTGAEGKRARVGPARGPGGRSRREVASRLGPSRFLRVSPSVSSRPSCCPSCVSGAAERGPRGDAVCPVPSSGGTFLVTFRALQRPGCSVAPRTVLSRRSCFPWCPLSCGVACACL